MIWEGVLIPILTQCVIHIKAHSLQIQHSVSVLSHIRGFMKGQDEEIWIRCNNLRLSSVEYASAVHVQWLRPIISNNKGFFHWSLLNKSYSRIISEGKIPWYEPYWATCCRKSAFWCPMWMHWRCHSRLVSHHEEKEVEMVPKFVASTLQTFLNNDKLLEQEIELCFEAWHLNKVNQFWMYHVERTGLQNFSSSLTHAKSDVGWLGGV